MRRTVLVLFSLLALVFLAPAQAGAQEGAPPAPRSMAALGDSMTQAVNVCCWYGNHPANSWTTGGAGWDGVLSHYERIRAKDAAIAGRNFNYAVSGARMSSGPAQAAKAVAQKVDYVTILLGANDVCTSSPSTMTSVDTFRTQVKDTLRTLDTGLPGRSRVFIASIPNVYTLWENNRSNTNAQWVWDNAGICRSMLSSARTEEERQAVLARIVAFNAVLDEECGAYVRCRYDDGALFGHPFTSSDVSVLDYFHPSLRGQSRMAELTWPKSWWN
jgi:lysophospholipase L1-like esterase